MFELKWTDEVRETYKRIKNNVSHTKRYKAVKKTIKFLSKNPRHTGPQTHEYMSLKGPDNEKVFAAYRIFWFYGLAKGMITILAITPHPQQY